MPANVLSNFLTGALIGIGITAFGIVMLKFYNWTRNRYGYGLPRRGGCIAWVLIVFGAFFALMSLVLLIARPPGGY